MEKVMEKGKLYNRDQRIFFLYKTYLLQHSLEEAKEEIDDYDLSEEQVEFALEIVSSIEVLEEQIIKFAPKDWKWERFNNLERAAILNGAAEIIIAKNSKPIVIDETVNFAKKYCGVKAQPLVNAILDKIGE